MNGRPFSKSERREIRRLAGLAHERELASALRELQSQFERWRRGEIDPFELNELIHKFHNGESRELYKYYVMGSDQTWSVAAAISRGVIEESEVAQTVLEQLRSIIELSRRWQENDDEA